jgi:selenocysteine-specific elongation factor
MFVLGTAGHIDHGKSVLVHALTGIDPDRLREEKERGMTIDLGFAWLKLPSGQEVGVVDVPGHERFVKNMLAGVGGIDLALLIVAANEGVMPQTKEHLAILDLLGVRRGIIVITKKDLVDEELLTLVRMDIEEQVAGTVMSGVPILAVSAITGEGIPELIAAIDKLLSTTEPKRDLGRPRLPVDRIFTISGSGTVVTGTLIDGELAVGQEVEIAPTALKSRLRGLQTHKSKIDRASPGSRVAANLVGINTSQLHRGDIVTRPGWLKSTKMVTVKLRLIGYLQRPLRHGATVSFHTGAAETMAKVRLLEGDFVQPGGSTWAQLSLERPVAVVKSDRYIIRSTTDTLGGGEIIDAHARRLRRLRDDVISNLKAREEGTAEDVILALLEARQNLEPSNLISQSNFSADEIGTALESLVQKGQIIRIEDGKNNLLLSLNGWERLLEKVSSMLEEYHRKFPIRSGIPRIELGSRLKIGNYGSAVIDILIKHGTVIEENGYIHLPSHKIQLTPSQQAKVDGFLESLARNPYAPPGQLIPDADLLNMLVGQGKVVKVDDGIVFATSAYNEMVSEITSYIKSNGKVSLGQVRDMFGTSRKYAQALLEYLDRQKITRRVGDDRILC